MSPRTRITTLNLGSQSIELANFGIRPDGGLILYGYRAREILADPTAETDRHGQVLSMLREMAAELQIKRGNLNYTVAEESTFTRFVKLPPIDNEKIERIIGFEAQQNVPFPIDQVVWDYQIVSCAGEPIQVILVAIKSDLLEEINRVVELTGLRTSVVDLATMAIYNAFRHNYSDLGGCSLLVDIGARTTNLLFIEPGKVFTRSIPIGGSSITAAIAKEFGEPFGAAEIRKKRDGLAILEERRLPGHEDDRVSKIVRTIMTRLHGELVRSISHYCTQQQGDAPSRLFLSGGGASTSRLHQFFHEKLQLPVEFFDPLRNVAVADSCDLKEITQSRHLLGEPVGLALRAAGECPIALNLRPASVARRAELEKRRLFLVAAAACLSLSLFAWGVYYQHSAEVLRHRTKTMEDKLLPLRRIESQLSDVRKEATSLDKMAAPLITAINDRSFWVQVIEELNTRLPKEDIWITDLVATSKRMPLEPAGGRLPRGETALFLSGGSARSGGGQSELVLDGLQVRGLYLHNQRQQEVVVDYFRNLTESSWFALNPKEQASFIKPSTPTNTEWAFPYELHLDLRQPLKFP